MTLENTGPTFIHSSHFNSALKSTTRPTQRRSRHSTDNVPEFNAEATQATVGERHAQCPYVAAREGVEPMTLRTKSVDSTNVTPTPHKSPSWIKGNNALLTLRLPSLFVISATKGGGWFPLETPLCLKISYRVVG